jgi:sulfur carrier protein
LEIYQQLSVSLIGMFMKSAREPFRQDMKLIFSESDKRIVNHSPAPVEQILLEAGINPLEVLVSRNGNLISEDTIAEAEDEILVIRIAHGG